MEDFEVMRDLTFGQYLPGESPIHRLDPRIKLLSTGLLLAALIASGELSALLLAFAAFIGLTVMARVPAGYMLRPLRAGWPFILLIVLLQLLTFPGVPGTGCDTVWRWWALNITTCSVRIAAADPGEDHRSPAPDQSARTDHVTERGRPRYGASAPPAGEDWAARQ